MKLLPATCALFLLSAPFTPRLAAEDVAKAAAAVNPQDVDAIIRAIPRREEALKPKLEFYDRMRQEYEAKTKDAGAAKTAGAAAVSAFARAFAGERECTEAFARVMKQLEATAAAGAKDPLLGLLLILSAHHAGYHLDNDKFFNEAKIRTSSDLCRREYGDASLSGLFAQLCSNRLAAVDSLSQPNVAIRLSGDLKAAPFLNSIKTLLTQMKNPAEEECLGELWFWGFDNSSPRACLQSKLNQDLITAFEMTDWLKELGDRPFARWLAVLQADNRGWTARSNAWATNNDDAVREAGIVYDKEMKRGLGFLQPDDRSVLAAILLTKCGGPIGSVSYDDGLRLVLRNFWSPAAFDVVGVSRNLNHTSRRWNRMAMQPEQLRPYMESSVRQHRWDLCERLLDCMIHCADNCSMNDPSMVDPFALGRIVARDHDWLAPWLAAARQGLSKQPGVTPETLAAFFSWQLACTENPKACRALLVEDATRKLSQLKPLILARLLGTDWKAKLSFKSACGHPLIGTELAAIGTDDPKSAVELRSFARQFKWMAKDADDEPLTKDYLAKRRWRYTQSLALMEGKSIDVPPDEYGWITANKFDRNGFIRANKEQPAHINLSPLILDSGIVIDADVQVLPGSTSTLFGLHYTRPNEPRDRFVGFGIDRGVATFNYRKAMDPLSQPDEIDRLCALPEAGIHHFRMTLSRQGYSLELDGLLMSQDRWELGQNLALILAAAALPWGCGDLPAQDDNFPRQIQSHGLGHVRIRALKAAPPLPVPLDAAALQGWEKNQAEDLALLIDSINQHLQQCPQTPLPFASLSPQTRQRLFASPVYRPPFSQWIQQQLKPRPCTPLARPAGNAAWTAQANSEENASLCAANLIDGNYGSLWHSDWSRGGGVLPLHVTLDLRQSQILEGLRLSRRTDGPNGTPASVFVQTSLDGRIWTGQRIVLAWQNGGGPRDLDVFFHAPASARFLRLNCYGDLAALAEVVPLAPAAKAPPVPSTNP